MPRLKEAAALQPPWVVSSGNVGPLLPAFTVLFCFSRGTRILKFSVKFLIMKFWLLNLPLG